MCVWVGISIPEWYDPTIPQLLLLLLWYHSRYCYRCFYHQLRIEPLLVVSMWIEFVHRKKKKTMMLWTCVVVYQRVRCDPRNNSGTTSTIDVVVVSTGTWMGYPISVNDGVDVDQLLNMVTMMLM